MYHSQGSLHIICSPNTFVQRPLRQYRKSKGTTMVFSLIILVTGNRKMGGMAGLMPQPYVSVCLFDHTTVWPQASLFPKGPIQDGRVLCPVFRDPPSAGTWCGRMAELHRVPSARQEGRLEATPRGPPQETEVSAPDAFSFCAFCPFSCWHTWGRTTASLLVAPSLTPRRASGTSRHSRHTRSWDSRRQACHIPDRSRSDFPTHLGSRKCSLSP